MKDVYSELGIPKVINAFEVVSMYGGSVMRPGVAEAMAAAARGFYHIPSLNAAVGRRLAELTHNQAALASCGTAASLALAAAAACHSGRDEIIVNLGLIEAALPNHEQLKADHYRQGLPIKAYVHRVEKTPIGPRVYLSRTHPEFLRKLMSREIPEIREAVVEIKGIARSPGFRSKVAVTSLDEKVDPVGACVGYRKSRIENIIKELSGEKVDIVQWSKDQQIFIARALGPAKVSEVIKEGDTHIVVVPDAEFSIAIGKKGQNVWLASLLCGVKIEVLKETDYRNRIIMSKAGAIPLARLGLDEALAGKLTTAGLNTAFDVLNATPEDLTRITELAPEAIEPLKQQVRDATWRVVEGKPVFTPPRPAAPTPAPEAAPDPAPAAEPAATAEPTETPAPTEQS